MLMDITEEEEEETEKKKTVCDHEEEMLLNWNQNESNRTMSYHSILYYHFPFINIS